MAEQTIVTEDLVVGQRLQSALKAVAEVVASRTAEATSESVDVTIVIPTYQHRMFVQETVAAALGQVTTASFEVIVIDDGSTDGSDVLLRELARTAVVPVRYVRLDRNHGRSIARNAGIGLARGKFIAFTDSDCEPTACWLAAGLAVVTASDIGIVQGRTQPNPEQRKPFFNHFIEIDAFDGTFSTCNILYRRTALFPVDGFDPAIEYWEDLDLGWRVRRSGWRAAFAADMLVYHQVLRLSTVKWLLWPAHFKYMPAKTAKYPEYRHYLFLRLWVNWFHALISLAVLALSLSLSVHSGLLALAIPYVVAFPLRHGLGGRWAPLKAVFHVAWDGISFGTLVLSSVRHRSLVL